MNDRAQFQKDHPWARVANSDTSGLAALGKVGEALLRKTRYSNPQHESQVREDLIKAVASTIGSPSSMPSFRRVSEIGQAVKTLELVAERPAIGDMIEIKATGIRVTVLACDDSGQIYTVRLPSGDAVRLPANAFTSANVAGLHGEKNFGGSLRKSASITKGAKIRTRDGRIGIVLSDAGDNLAVTAQFTHARGNSLEVLLPGEFSPA